MHICIGYQINLSVLELSSVVLMQVRGPVHAARPLQGSRVCAAGLARQLSCDHDEGAYQVMLSQCEYVSLAASCSDACCTSTVPKDSGKGLAP